MPVKEPIPSHPTSQHSSCNRLECLGSMRCAFLSPNANVQAMLLPEGLKNYIYVTYPSESHLLCERKRQFENPSLACSGLPSNTYSNHTDLEHSVSVSSFSSFSMSTSILFVFYLGEYTSLP